MRKILDQPNEGTLGDLLEDNLMGRNKSEYNKAYFLVAYARRSGVARLAPLLQRFRSVGGEVTVVVGIDQKNTSVEALTQLVDLCDDVFVYHDESFSRTYHPKVYLFEAPDQVAWGSVGSSNLTGGGLYGNYEINETQNLDLTTEEGAAKFEQLLSIVNRYSNTQDTRCKETSLALIEELQASDYIDSEESLRQTLVARKREHLKRVTKLFGTAAIAEPPTRILSPEQDGVINQVEATNIGFWKKLSNFDVSTSSAPGQMIIPIAFKDFFPAMDEVEIMENGAEQSSTFFNLVLRRSGEQPIRVDNARTIYYVPSPEHARPNSELRFTFRNRSILQDLNRDDILEFRYTTEPSVLFTVRHIKVSDPEYANYGSQRFRRL